MRDAGTPVCFAAQRYYKFCIYANKCAFFVQKRPNRNRMELQTKMKLTNWQMF